MNTAVSSNSRAKRSRSSVDGRKQTLEQYLGEWLGSRRALRETTVRSYETHIRRYLVPYLGRIRLCDLQRSHIEAMYDQLLDPGHGAQLSTSTVVRVHATLMSALNAAVRSGLMAGNPAQLVELPQVDVPVQTVWSPTELMDFLGGIGDDACHVLYTLLGTRGLRRSEALGLRWCDVDVRVRRLRVVQQLSSYGGQISFGPPKSKAGGRLVAFDQRLAELLSEQWRVQRSYAREHGWNQSDETLVFTTAGGGPLDPVWVTRHFDQLVRASGLPRIRLHDLRHTSASIGLASGESLLEVSRRLGHSSVAVTGDIYTQVSAETAQASADRFAAYVQKRR